MASRDERIDAYIAKAQPFAPPILQHLRTIVHAACPEVEETIKWSFPNFMYRGSILCSMAAFKSHCAFGFWRGRQLAGVTDQHGAVMGDFGRIGSLKDLPSKARLTALVKAAMRLNEAGVKRVPKKKAAPRKPLPVPKDLAAALGRDAKAKRAFDAFAPSHRREYIEWITEAKTDATRERRLATTLEWLAEGKSRNWKYQ